MEIMKYYSEPERYNQNKADMRVNKQNKISLSEPRGDSQPHCQARKEAP